ncbi:hypothetical protein MLD38_004769 [Melastoma candidum]|uniref:Uncharacterized protein n=1 Tax=Melastoma candidum TaxID=119954 RepID=A0ACB9S6R7_9MYRT|nr:hypothetical protein MLD38_004769 [Melastoma candidum]
MVFLDGAAAAPFKPKRPLLCTMALVDLFVTAFISILKVLLLTALGLFLAIGPVDALGEEARKHLNNYCGLSSYLRNRCLSMNDDNYSESGRQCSVILLWAYASASVSLTLGLK